jgi:hypothetical protein
MSVIPLLLLAALPLPAGGDSLPGRVDVQVDSSRHEVVITAGPFDLPNMSGRSDHGMSHDTPVFRFNWPVNGWFRGFRIEVLDSAGHPLPRKLMHHMIMINYDRRQLIYPAAERLWGAGVETGSFSLPKTIGVPLRPETPLGMYIAWHNDTGADLPSVRLKIWMLWTPSNQLPRPVDVLPLYFDVNLTVGGDNQFDIPPGRSEKAYEFTVPTDGRILGVSGHLHQYGREVRLEDPQSGRILTRVEARVKPNGGIRGMERHLFGVAGEGLKLKAGHRYRVVAVYDNPTGDTLVKGAMGSLVGIYAPSRMDRWPAINPGDSLYARDLHFLARRGFSMRKMARKQEARDSAAASPHEHHHD